MTFFCMTFFCIVIIPICYENRLVCCCCSLPSRLLRRAPKLTTVKLASGLSVGVPAGFTPLPDDGIAVKYPSPRKPLAVYSNPSGRVDYSVAVRPTTFESFDYGVLIKIYKSSIQRLYTKVDFIKEDIRTVNGRDFMYFEFVSTVADTPAQRRASWPPSRSYQAVQYAIRGAAALRVHLCGPGRGAGPVAAHGPGRDERHCDEISVP